MCTVMKADIKEGRKEGLECICLSEKGSYLLLEIYNTNFKSSDFQSQTFPK